MDEVVWHPKAKRKPFGVSMEIEAQCRGAATSGTNEFTIKRRLQEIRDDGSKEAADERSFLRGVLARRLGEKA